MWKRLLRRRQLTCGQVRVQLLPYFDGELSPARQQLIREHMANCYACTRYAREVNALESDLAAAAEHRVRGFALSPQVSARIQERIYRRMRRALIVERVTQITGRIVAAVALMALAVGLFVLWQRASLEENGDQEIRAVSQDEITVITFACHDYQRSRYEALVRDFEAANPDIRVQFVSADEASGQQRQGNTVISDGKEIERLTAAVDTFVWFASLRAEDWTFLLDLGPFVDDPSFPADDFYPGMLDHFRWQGGIYGLPAEITPFLLFYDRGMFDEAGVSYPHIGWTWDDLVEAAIRLTEREGDRVKRYGFVDALFSPTLQAMMQQHGVSLWDDRTDPPEPLFDAPAVADVLRRYTDMALKYEIMPVPEIGSNVMASTLVDEGRAAIWTDFASSRDYHARRTDLGLAPFPEAVGAANPHSTYGFFVSAGTAHPEAAWRWLSYLSANYQPRGDGRLPARRSVGEQLSWWRGLDEGTKAVFQYALAHPFVSNDALNSPLIPAIIDVFEEGVGIDEALAMAQARAIKLQASLAEITPSTPQPVSTPRSTPGEGQTVITFAPAHDADLSLYRKLAVDFIESHPDVWVEVVPAPAKLAELTTASDCFAGTFPIHLSEIRQNIRSLQPLLQSDASFDLSDYYPQFLDSLQEDGELWGLPYEADALMVYTNLDRFAEAGVTPPGPGWSSEDFLELAVTLSGSDRYGFTTREGAYGDLIFVLERLGARLVDSSQDPPLPTFDDPTVVPALRRYADSSRGGALSPATPSARSGWPDSVLIGGHPPNIETGQVAMWVDSISFHNFSPTPPFETGVAPLPVGTQASTEFEVGAYYISIHAGAPQACWEWLTFLSGQPEAVQLLPARRSVTAFPLWQKRVGEAALPAYRATLEYADTSLFDLRWEIPWMGYAYPWLEEAFQATVGGENAEQALGEAQIKAEMLLACLETVESFYDRDQTRACARQVDPNYPLADDAQ